MTRSTTFRLLPATVIMAMLGWIGMGCATTTDLQPAPGATDVVGLEEAARTSVDGVSVLTQVDEWPGAQPISNEVTPIRIRIENNSGEAIAVQYDEFTLVGPEGERYSALPPFQIEGSVEEPVMATTYSPIAEPAFVYDRFEVAPLYGDLYPGLTPFGDPFYYDPVYYDNTFTYWQDVQMPTQEMLAQAMPEGVVRPGGWIEGWVYFENVPDDVQMVTLRADIVDAMSGNEIGEIRIPYEVQ